MSSQTAQSYLPVVAAMLNGNYTSNIDSANERKRLAPYSIAVNSDNKTNSISSTTKSTGNNNSYIGVIQLSGVVTKEDQNCGPKGTKSLAAQVKAYQNDDSCIGMVGVIDSPGGQVSYTDLLADEIRNFSKPNACLVEGKAASGGYWIASSFNNIYVSSALNSVGSIGAFISIKDFSGSLEKLGVKIIDIYAPQSKDKNKDVRDALAGNLDAITNDVLKPIVSKFINDVKLNRTEIDETVFTGKMYQTAEAISLGMVDGIKSFDEVVNSILEQNNNLNQNKNMNTAEKKYTHIAKAAGFDNDNLVLIDGHSSISESAMDLVESSLEELDSLKAKNADLVTANTDLQAKFDAKVAAFETFKTSAAAGPASTKKEGDSFVDETQKTKEDDFAHNRAADEFLN